MERTDWMQVVGFEGGKLWGERPVSPAPPDPLCTVLHQQYVPNGLDVWLPPLGITSGNWRIRAE